MTCNSIKESLSKDCFCYISSLIILLLANIIDKKSCIRLKSGWIRDRKSRSSKKECKKSEKTTNM